MLRYAHTISSASRRLASRHPMFCDPCTAGPRQFYPLRNNNFQYKELTNEFDLNNALGKYRTDSSAIITSLKNKPSEIRNSGEATIDWYPADERNTYGIQIMRWTFGTTHMIFTRNKLENTWAEWVQYATKSDFVLQTQTLYKNVVIYRIGNIAMLSASSWVRKEELAGLTIPTGYRPVKNISIPFTQQNFNDGAYCDVSAEGKIDYTGTSPIVINAVWFCA